MFLSLNVRGVSFSPATEKLRALSVRSFSVYPKFAEGLPPRGEPDGGFVVFLRDSEAVSQRREKNKRGNNKCQKGINRFVFLGAI